MNMFSVCVLVLLSVGTNAQLKSRRDSFGCPSVFNNTCYQFVIHEKRTHAEAEEECLSNGGMLAMIKNADVQDFLYDYGANSLDFLDEIWIGLDDRQTYGHFVWADGTNLLSHDYNNSDNGRWSGNFFHHDTCVVLDMGNHGKWKPETCRNEFQITNYGDNEFAFICQYDISADMTRQPNVAQQESTTPTVSHPDLLGCPSSIVQTLELSVFDNTCYQFVTNQERTHAEAEDECLLHGGTLATIKTADVQDFLYGYLGKSLDFRDELWIGLDDRQTYDHFVWADGTNLLSNDYNNSDNGRWSGNFFHHDTCVVLDMGNHGKWKPETCRNEFQITNYGDNEFAFICQYDI